MKIATGLLTQQAFGFSPEGLATANKISFRSFFLFFFVTFSAVYGQNSGSGLEGTAVRVKLMIKSPPL